MKERKKASVAGMGDVVTGPAIDDKKQLGFYFSYKDKHLKQKGI